MTTHSDKSRLLSSRRTFLLLPLALIANQLLPEAAEAEMAPAVPAGVCPLNSGGPSLLGSKWRLQSVYGTPVPTELDITMEVGQTSLIGFAGCNNYNAAFKRVGYTGFRMTKVDKTKHGCTIIGTYDGGPTINVGDWEGMYIRTLQRAGSVEQLASGNVLQFHNRSGEKSVTFRRTYGNA